VQVAELGRGGEAAGPAHGRDQGGPADGGQAGQAAGQGRGVDPLVAGLPLPGVPLQLGLGSPQQPDLAGHLGGQLGEGNRGVVTVQLQCGAGGGQPVGGPLGALLTGRCAGQHLLQSGMARGHQRMRVRPALEHGQVGLAELTDKGACRQQLMDQVLDAALGGRGLTGEPITGPHAAVQCCLRRLRQLPRVQPGRVNQREAGQGVGVDAVGLGMARQHPAQVMGFGRADPVHDVAAGNKEHRDRQPRRAGRFHHHLKQSASGGLGQRGLFYLPRDWPPSGSPCGGTPGCRRRPTPRRYGHW
jgi:hypothetical protein